MPPWHRAFNHFSAARLQRYGERPLPDARGLSPGAPKGNKNSFKHGNYSARGIAERRQVSALIRNLRALANSVELYQVSNLREGPH